MRLPVFMRLLTGNGTSIEAWWTGEIMLAWFLTTIATHSTTKRIFVMTGHERRLLRYGIGEAVANVALSITMVKLWPHPASVAVGSIIPTLLFGWLGLWPWAAREAGISPFALLVRTMSAGMPIALSVAGSLWVSGRLFGAGDAPSLPAFLVEASIAGLVGLSVAAGLLRDEIRIFRRRPVAVTPTCS